MRCLILIALCFVLANASYMNKNRFHKLLNRFQQNRFDQDDLYDRSGLFGSDDLDNHIDDYVDEIRRERMFERDQCPRDFEDVLGQDDDDQDDDRWDTMGSWSKSYGRKYNEDDDMERTQNWEDDEDFMGRGRKYETSEDTEETRGYSVDEESQVRSPLLQEIKRANVEMTTRLYEEAKNEKDDKNTVISPLAIQLALATLNSGARGNTKRQIARIIGGSLKTEQRKRVFKALIRHLKGYPNQEYSSGQRTNKINMVTGLFVTKTTRAQQMFIREIKLGATVKHCSFSHKPQQCRQDINQWMAQKTQGKIQRIVPVDAITDNTKMVLVNAMHMKANWGPQMRRHVTKQTKFYPLDSNKAKVVEVLETEGRFKYYEDELVKIVGVPTKQEELTLYTLVPKDKDGLTELEKIHLQDNVQLEQLLEKTDKHVRRVHVQLPKFQIKHKIDVRRTLLKQGVTDAFDPIRADFSGITGLGMHEQDQMDNTYGSMGRGEKKLHLNKFIHQCTIKISETGITATTGSQTEDEYEPFGRSTGRPGFGGWESEFEDEDTIARIFPSFLGGSSGKNVVKANHAFAFVLKHNPTKQIVMVGRVIDAAQKKTSQWSQTINGVDQL